MTTDENKTQQHYRGEDGRCGFFDEWHCHPKCIVPNESPTSSVVGEGAEVPRVKLYPLKSTWVCPTCKTSNTVDAYHMDEPDRCFNCNTEVQLGITRPTSSAVEGLVEAVRFVKMFLNDLEDHAEVDGDKTLLCIRRIVHKPLHDKLDAALAAHLKELK